MLIGYEFSSLFQKFLAEFLPTKPLLNFIYKISDWINATK